jgi:iron-sulfur cluster repair protein YtfE (RIC family)
MTNTTNPAPVQLTDVRDMYVVHKVFRREFALIPRLIRAVAPGDIRRAAVVAGHARLVLGGLDMHHTGEDALLWPKLLERDAPDSALIHRMEAQHHRVEELIAELTDALPRWEAEARPAVGEELASTFDGLRVALLEHLDDEEAHILPIAARCVTQEEWNGLGEHGMAKVEKSQLPILFGAMLEEATPDEKKLMLTLVPPPVRLLVRTVFAWQYRRYITKVRAPLSAR